MRVTSLSRAASLIQAENFWLPQRRDKRVYRRGKLNLTLRAQRLRGGPACFRQLQEDIDIQSGLVAGVTAVETTTSRASPYRQSAPYPCPDCSPRLRRWINITRVWVTEIATLIGTHDLIMFRLYRQRVSTDDTAIRKRLSIVRYPAQVGLFCHGVAAGLATGKQGQQRNLAVLFILPAWNISLHIGILRPLP